MKIAILGTGYVARALGGRLCQLGHQVHFGSRSPESEKSQGLLAADQSGWTVESPSGATNQSDLIILAVPWTAAQQTLESAGPLDGKTVIDCTNPLNERFDDLALGFSESAAEQIAQWAPGAHIVKALNTISAQTMQEPQIADSNATVFYCGDHEDSKQSVGKLLEELGLDGVDSGPLKSARLIEPMAMLCIRLSMEKRVSGNCGLKLLRE